MWCASLRWFRIRGFLVLLVVVTSSPRMTIAQSSSVKAFDDPKHAADFPGPLSPEESLAAISIHAGLEMKLVAAEPLVADPVAFDFGPDGRLWVVEMGDYPRGLDGQGKPGGRVKVLVDDDGDGRYDRATVFLEGLGFPTGVKVWRSGAIVTAAPTVFYAEDQDGNGRADLRKVLFEGFIQGNQQHRVNGLRWGLDNWLYLANGDSGGKIRSIATGQEADIGGRDLRIRPDDGQLDPLSGRTQFGRNRDDWGNWFGGNNSNPMWHYVLDDRYLRRNADIAGPDPRVQISVAPGASPVFPLSRTLARFNNPDKANHFTSAASPIIYRDHLLGEEFAGNAFICEPVHNLVHREIVTSRGLTFTSRRADEEQQSEFLASRDSWFRPVIVRTGPDGALWIADMYRLVIEHPEWIPPSWQERLDLRAGSDRGRIYRVVPVGKIPPPIPHLEHLDISGLVQTLESPNGTLRDLAQQIILWRNDATAVPLLEHLARAKTRPLARLHALCALEGLNRLSDELLRHALDDAHPAVRREAIRLCEPRLADRLELGEKLLTRLDDPDPQVQLQLAATLGFWNDPRAGVALGQLAVKHQNDPYVLAYVYSSLSAANVENALVAALTQSKAGKPAHSVLERLLVQATLHGNEQAARTAMTIICMPENDRLAPWQLAALAGVLDGLGKQGRLLVQLLEATGQEHLQRAFVQARAAVADPSSEEPGVITAMRLVARGATDRESDLRLLARRLSPQNSPAIQLAAVGTLQRRGDALVPELLLAEIHRYSPGVRGAVLDALLERAEWAEDLLAAIERGQATASMLDATRRTRLLSHPDQSIRSRAEAVFSGAIQTNRQQVVEMFRPALSLMGDIQRGRESFRRRCAACHRIEDLGHAVGPDMAAVKDRSPEAILMAVLDPNRAVEDRYVTYAAQTDDGRIVTGVLVSETGASITLRGPEGKDQVLPRNRLEELKNLGKSLMPEGLEKDLSREELADLMAFLAVGENTK